MGSSAEHKQLKNDGLEWLAIAGYFAWANETGAAEIDGRFMKFGKKGSADIIAVIQSRHCEFEAKTGDAAQSKHQKIHQQMVEKHGGLYIVFHSVAELQSKLAGAGYSGPFTGNR
jgi:hypothetical protein